VICARAKIFMVTVAVAMPVKTHAITMTSVDRCSFMFIAVEAMFAVSGVRMASVVGGNCAHYMACLCLVFRVGAAKRTV
jgi:hypothetical protein